jgi:hypothetical protein
MLRILKDAKDISGLRQEHEFHECYTNFTNLDVDKAYFFEK